MAIFGRVAQPVGLDIGSDVIRVAQLKPAANPILTKYGEQRTEGCLVDGETTDIELLAKQINELWKNTKIDERRVVLGISNQKIIARLLTIPHMEKEDLESAIQFQAQENIPIPIEETILDYQIIKDFKNADNERMLQIMLVAAQKEMINNHIAALEKAKLKPYIVDVSSFALSRSLIKKEAVVPDEKEIEKNTQIVGFLDIGESVTNISIVQDRMPLFSRVTPIGNNTFVKALSDNLGLSFEEAEKQLKEFGFAAPRADINAGLPPEKIEEGQKVRNVLSNEAMKFVSEVKRSFEYGLSEAVKSEELSELVISGIGSEDKSLIAHLEDNYQKVTIGDLFSYVNVKEGTLVDNKEAYAIAVGLALRGIDE